MDTEDLLRSLKEHVKTVTETETEKNRTQSQSKFYSENVFLLVRFGSRGNNYE